MTSILSWLRRKHLFFPIFTFSIFTYGIIPGSAQTEVRTEIRNTARVGADNIPERPGGRVVDSNNVTVRASQAALEVIKTGSHASAEPGDTVAYNVVVRNSGTTTTAEKITITDRLPLGLLFIGKSLGVLYRGQTQALDPKSSSINSNAATVTIDLPENIQLRPNESLIVSYAVEVTPDAVRGTGRNLAQARNRNLTSNQASHTLRIRSGIVSDCGTLIGRVFVDKNFDGEQQRNEPGVPNAIIYMDDGNRIVTDANGLYSLANVVSGYRSATLDLTSLPGYALAPNNYFIERNSQSRMVRLAPGSMARVNFAVTPAFSEGKR
ncbi:hypothetical protein NIES4071_71140 [Calothrix sp. NIES-4071]|nr:hypothetical protein NIES4071_71140 [Calothrix sp. NIES-4071]BAZ61389.1 hypothetical protein NIES4105_71090 [Calothrix sp. NIES-4105]